MLLARRACEVLRCSPGRCGAVCSVPVVVVVVSIDAGRELIQDASPAQLGRDWERAALAEG